MKKNYLLPFLLLIGYGISAQVGINTSDPKATLHVQKRSEITFADGIIPPRISGDSLRLKEAAYGPAQNGAIVFVTSSVTTTGPKTTGVTSKGLFIYDAFAPNTSGTGQWNIIPEGPPSPTAGIGDGAYSAKFVTNFSLLGVSVGNNVINLNLGGGSGGTTTVQVPSTSMSNGIYTVPSTGIYEITYHYREGSGVSASVLTDSGIQILKTPTGSTTATILDSRLFSGIGAIITVSITETTINHLYSLTAGDKIQFGINRNALLGISLLTVSEADISIHRVK